MVIVICGPTGSGKSHLAFSVLKHASCEIISGDAFQVYEKLNIGTNKPTKLERSLCPHHLFDFVNLNDSYNVFLYQKDVRRSIDEVQKHSNIPLIVGGTALYIKAGLYDYVFESEAPHSSIDYSSLSNEELFQRLNEIDEVAAAHIHPNNRKRLIRALTIYESSGKKKSDIIDSQEHKLLYDALFVGIDIPRDELYQKINQRVDQMFEQGLLDEVKNILEEYDPSSSGLQAIGYKETIDMIINNKNLEETKELIKKHTRNYAKRQMTFFRNKLPVHWFNNEKEALEYILGVINGK